MKNSHEDSHPDGEGNRYRSAHGWDPNNTKPDEREIARKFKRAREKHHRENAARKAIAVRTASEWLDEADPPAERRDLFPPFWREGELAVLTGPPGVGKSLLAVQLADALAGTRASLPARLPLPAADCQPMATLLIDLHRTPSQLAELYRDHKFSARLEWGLLDVEEIPESYNGRRESFYLDAIVQRLAVSEASVVIIDNLSWLTRNGTAAELYPLMKTFRLWVNTMGLSMLLLRHSREDARSGDQPAAFELADSIFALRPGTMGDNIRYIKSLRSRLQTPDARLAHSEVHVYELAGTRASLPARSATENTEHTDYGIVRSLKSLDRERYIGTPHSKLRTPHFRLLGTCEEAAMIRDYAAEAKAALDAEEKRRRLLWKRSSKEILIDGMLDGSYARYLKGE